MWHWWVHSQSAEVTSQLVNSFLLGSSYHWAELASPTPGHLSARRSLKLDSTVTPERVSTWAVGLASLISWVLIQRRASPPSQPSAAASHRTYSSASPSLSQAPSLSSSLPNSGRGGREKACTDERLAWRCDLNSSGSVPPMPTSPLPLPPLRRTVFATFSERFHIEYSIWALLPFSEVGRKGIMDPFHRAVNWDPEKKSGICKSKKRNWCHGGTRI